MVFETTQISRWPDNINSSVRLLLKAGVGLSFVFATLCPANYPQPEKHHSSHTVDQLGCHSEHRNDKITKLASSVRQCRGCGQHQELSSFASKGRDRSSTLCKSCDNKRRRSSYLPTTTTPDWDHITVNLEAASASDQNQLAPLIWEILTEHKFVCDGKNDFTDETLDSLLNRRSAIDGIIERGST